MRWQLSPTIMNELTWLATNWLSLLTSVWPQVQSVLQPGEPPLPPVSPLGQSLSRASLHPLPHSQGVPSQASQTSHPPPHWPVTIAASPTMLTPTLTTRRAPSSSWPEPASRRTSGTTAVTGRGESPRWQYAGGWEGPRIILNNTYILLLPGATVIGMDATQQELLSPVRFWYIWLFLLIW